jgi:hypothetical protein
MVAVLAVIAACAGFFVDINRLSFSSIALASCSEPNLASSAANEDEEESTRVAPAGPGAREGTPHLSRIARLARIARVREENDMNRRSDCG